MKNSLELINTRLKAAKMGVAVVQRGDRLSLRATLPPRPGSESTKPVQQYLTLGVYANPAGLKVAEEKAKELAVDITRWKGIAKFDWDKWLLTEKPGNTCKHWIEAFKEEFLERRKSFSEYTWKRQYLSIFLRLPQDAELSEELLLNTLLKTPGDTWTRQHTTDLYQRLADFAELDIKLSVYRGDYGRKKYKTKRIPSDDEIVAARAKFVSGSPWEWAYGVLAAYGLRPHEVFFCEISPETPHSCKVLEGKTGSRTCYPLRPEWLQEWHLWETKVPPISTKEHYNEYGKNVGQAFWKREIEFSPYCLRHAYAIRAACFYKIPIPTAAAWCGHSSYEF